MDRVKGCPFLAMTSSHVPELNTLSKQKDSLGSCHFKSHSSTLLQPLADHSLSEARGNDCHGTGPRWMSVKNMKIKNVIEDRSEHFGCSADGRDSISLKKNYNGFP